MSRARSSALGAYEMLLEAIEIGELPPGSRLREIELAERFGVSRTPVREALKRLESQSLVVHQPHVGAMVAELAFDDVAQLYYLREVLEGTAARLAATHATQTEIDVLRTMVEHDRTIISNPIELSRRNKMFHHQLHLSARNRFLLETLENMRMSLVLLAGSTLAAPDRGVETIAEHDAIVEAIAAHEPAEAEAAARRHIASAFRTRILQQFEPALGS